MKNNTKIKAMLTAMALVSGEVDAQDFYVGGNFAAIEYSETGIDDDADLTALYGRVGTIFNDYLSAEVRAGFGVGDDSVGVLGFDVDVELENLYGVYLRGGIPTGSAVYPYIVVGYTRGEVKASFAGFTESESESDFSYGVGTDIEINDRVNINVEYINYLDKGETEVTGLAIGATWSF